MGQQDIPIASGLHHAKVFESMGWTLTRSKKSHYVLHKFGCTVVSFPDHSEVARNLVQAELRKAGVNSKDYRDIFNRVI